MRAKVIRELIDEIRRLRQKFELERRRPNTSTVSLPGPRRGRRRRRSRRHPAYGPRLTSLRDLTERTALATGMRWPPTGRALRPEERWSLVRTGDDHGHHRPPGAFHGDNAAMESFFSLLQKNVLDRRRWRTRDELISETIVWIEHIYNRRRRQRGLSSSPRSSLSSPSPPPPCLDDDADAA